jgi:hypothetical protein
MRATSIFQTMCPPNIASAQTASYCGWAQSSPTVRVYFGSPFTSGLFLRRRKPAPLNDDSIDSEALLPEVWSNLPPSRRSCLLCHICVFRGNGLPAKCLLPARIQLRVPV